jgi:hypothetical protein
MGHSPVWVQLVTALHRMSEAQIKRTRLVGVALPPFFRRATSE